MIGFLKQKVLDLKKHQLMDDRMILNCAFLLDKDNEKDFDIALNDLNSKYEEKINFKCVGPLPPYSFSTIEVKKVSYEEIDEARKLLGLGEETTNEEIKESYHRMAGEYHPDKDPGNYALAKKFEDITKAYKMLQSFCQKGEGSCSFKRPKAEDLFIIEAMKI